MLVLCEVGGAGILKMNKLQTPQKQIFALFLHRIFKIIADNSAPLGNGLL